ncbi:hypothetical protein KOR34_13630 [Posidoniimonas corsicana]|uniref:PEP-CTERM protein-sorting domain-containing protein n=1 Tax=Posidoniimonas corsicana TaxID=1938618 RepID=A0A5C5VEV4_9BACT|nr:hypothetical protein KOR34_13630 [Posidoniimonas corsicana]
MNDAPLGLRIASLTPAALLAAAIWCGHSPAATIYSNGAVNLISTASPDVEAQDGPGATSTILNVVSGADIAAAPSGDPNEGRSIGLTGSSVLLFSGGSAAGDIQAADNSVAFIVGSASVGGNIEATGAAEVQISSSANIGGNLLISGAATATMFGGVIDDLEAGDDAVVTFSSTARVDDDAFFTGSSRLVASGGRFDDELQFFDNTSAHFTGGEVNDDLVVAGSAQVVIDYFQVDDTIEASDSSHTTINGGLISNVEAAGNSVVEINGGVFAPEGGAIGSFGGRVTATGGVFGVAGSTDAIEIPAVAGGAVRISGVEVAGAGDGMAPPAVIANSLNGSVELNSMRLGDLSVNTITGASTTLRDLVAGAVAVELQAGTGEIDITSADSLSVTADLGSRLDIKGGDFGASDLRVLGGSSVRIFGSDFLVNGIVPVGSSQFPYVVPFGSGSISGTLADGSAFSTTFARAFGGNTEIVLIPEPASATLVLLAAASALMRRRGC